MKTRDNQTSDDFAIRRHGNQRFERLYRLGRDNGESGGKLIGAWGGRFLMFYADDKLSLRGPMRTAALQEVRFRFDLEGTKVVTQS